MLEIVKIKVEIHRMRSIWTHQTNLASLFPEGIMFYHF